MVDVVARFLFYRCLSSLRDFGATFFVLLPTFLSLWDYIGSVIFIACLPFVPTGLWWLLFLLFYQRFIPTGLHWAGNIYCQIIFRLYGTYQLLFCYSTNVLSLRDYIWSVIFIACLPFVPTGLWWLLFLLFYQRNIPTGLGIFWLLTEN